MVLNKKIISGLLLFFIQVSLSAQIKDIKNSTEEEYVNSIFRQILQDSPDGIILDNEIESMKLSFSQQEKYWLPSIQFDLSAKSNLMQGDYNYIKNSGIISGPQNIISPTLNFSVVQNLPGNGKLSFNAGYSLSYLPGKNAYLQQPYIQLGLKQPLFYGAFLPKYDLYIQKLNNQKTMAELEFQKAQFDLLQRYIEIVKNYDLALLSKNYYSVLLKQIQASYSELDKRYNLGQRTEVELFNLHMKESEALQNLQAASLNITQNEMALKAYKRDDILENSSQFRSGILTLLNKDYTDVLQESLEEYKILYEIEDLSLSLKNSKFNYTPSVYVQLSISPNDDNKLFTDFSRSLRDLSEFPESFSVNASLGISIPVDNFSQIKSLNEVTSMKKQNLFIRLEELRRKQIDMQKLYDEWFDSVSDYCDYISTALQKEEEYMLDTRKLFDNKIITESEYWEIEVYYYANKLSYCRSLWQIIQYDLNILNMSSKWIDFIKQFTEV